MGFNSGFKGLKLQARGFMEVWNGHPISLHRFIKSDRIAVRVIANGDNT